MGDLFPSLCQERGDDKKLKRNHCGTYCRSLERKRKSPSGKCHGRYESHTYSERHTIGFNVYTPGFAYQSLFLTVDMTL